MKRIIKSLKSRVEFLADCFFSRGLAIKKYYLTLTAISVAAVFVFALVIFAATFTDDAQSEFDTGTYWNTQWDAVNGWVEITASSTQELPDNASSSGFIDMTGNVLLTHMNESSGTIVDSSGGGNDGSYNGVLYSQTGKLNTAIGFDGVDDYIDYGDILGGESEITISTWIKHDTSTIGDLQGIVTNLYNGGNDPWTMRSSTIDNKIECRIENSSGTLVTITSDTSVNDDIWHNIVCRYDGTSASIWVDGIQEGTPGQLGGNLHQGDENVCIGVTCDVGSPVAGTYWNGAIDEAAIWNRALSADEIAKIYGYQKPTYGEYASNIKDSDYNETGWSSVSWDSNIPVAPASSESSSATGSGSGTSYTRIDRSWKLDNGEKVMSVGAYFNEAQTNMKFKIVERQSASDYDVKVDEGYSHTGGGWQWYTLSTPYPVPATGDFYLAIYHPSSTNSLQPSALRSYYSGEMTGDNNAMSEDTGSTASTGVIYGEDTALKLQVRSCDDSACSGENFIGPDGTISNYYNSTSTTPLFTLTNVPDNRYFQYKVFFETLNSSYSPELKSLTIDYDDGSPPRILGTIYRDTDGDGIKDAGENGIKNVTVQIWLDADNSDTVTAGDTVVAGDITDANGDYSIDTGANGEYIIHISDVYNKAIPGAMTTASAALAVTLSGGADSAGNDIGFSPANLSTGKVSSTVEINSGVAGGLALANSDEYGQSVASMGDLDGDGVTDVAVGSMYDDNGGTDRGAVHISFLNADSGVKSTVEINSGTTNGPVLSGGDQYGSSIASLGDIDGDGVNDLAVGAIYDDAGGINRGAVHIHFLNTDGTLKNTVEINDNTVNGPVLANSDWYGTSIASLGDLDGDGVTDIAVGAKGDDTGGSFRGAVHISFLNADGSVKSTVKIDGSTANGPVLSDIDYYGVSVASLGDIDGDNITDIAVGATHDNTGGADRGAVHISFLNADGSVKSTIKIDNDTTGGPILADNDQYGASIAALGDIDGDNIPDIAVGAILDDIGGTDRGAVHISFLNSDGTLKKTVEINDDTVSGPALSDNDNYGVAIASIGDLDGDGAIDIIVGANLDDAGGTSRGAVHIHNLKRVQNIVGTIYRDLDGDGIKDGGESGIKDITVQVWLDADNSDTITAGDSVVGGDITDANGDYTIDAGGGGEFVIKISDAFVRSTPGAMITNPSALAITLLGSNGSAGNNIGFSTAGIFERKISSTVEINSATANGPILADSDSYGSSAVSLGDLDGDGINDLVVGAMYDDTGGTNQGAVHISFLNSDRSVKSTVKIDSSTANGPTLANNDYYGASVASLGDVDGDGVVDIAVGAYLDDTGGTNRGAVHISFLNIDGSIKNTVKIDSTTENGPVLANSDQYGISIASLGDLDGDGISDLIVGVNFDDTGGTNRGAVHISFLNANGSLKSTVKIDDTTVNGPVLADNDNYGRSITSIGDLDNDGVTDIAVGAYLDDTGGADRGAVYISFLNTDGSLKSTVKIDDTIANGPVLLDSDQYGASVAFVGDLDGDGVGDLAVGAYFDDYGGADRGAVHIHFLNTDGSVKKTVEINDLTAGGPALANTDQYGASVASLGDLDGNGSIDLAVGAIYDDVGGVDRGVAHLHNLQPRQDILGTIYRDLNGDGVKDASELGIKNVTIQVWQDNDNSDTVTAGDTVISSDITDASGNYSIDAESNGEFVIRINDIFNKAAPSAMTTASSALAVTLAGGVNSAGHDIGFGVAKPSAGKILSTVEINNTTMNGPMLLDNDYYGTSVASLGDLDGDGITDIIVGTNGDDTGGTNRGAARISFLNADGSVKSTVKIDNTTANGPTLADNDNYGISVSPIGDLDGDGVGDIAVGAHGDDANGTDKGAVYISFLNTDGSLKSTVKIDDLTANGPALAASDYYGFSIAPLGDLDGDGIIDIAVGAYRDDAGGTDRGAVHIHFLYMDGSVKQTVEIRSNTANGPTLANSDYYGYSIASLGDLDGDGINDLAVGAAYDDAGGTNRGAVHISFLNTDGSVKNTVEVNSDTINGPSLANSDIYGSSVASLGDLDGDGITDIAVGAMYDDTNGVNRGALQISFLNTDGSVKNTIKINDTTVNGPTLDDSDIYGRSVASLGDLNSDGVTDIIVGAYADDVTGTNRGTVHIHTLKFKQSILGTIYRDTDEDGVKDGGENGIANVTVQAWLDNDGSGTVTAGDTPAAGGLTDANGDYVMDTGTGGEFIISVNDAFARAAPGSMTTNPAALAVTLSGGADSAGHDIGFAPAKASAGKISSIIKIDGSTAGGPTLLDSDNYGISTVSIGDLDGDGITDMAVGAHLDDTGGTNRGAVYIHFLNADGTIKSTAKIDNDTANGPTLADSNYYGRSIAPLGDLDGDGVTDIVVGAYGDDTNGTDRGAVYINFLNTDGSVKRTVKIDDTTVSGPVLTDSDQYGWSVASLGDLNGDGITDIAVGARLDDAGSTDRGAVHIHFLNIDGSVKSTVEINDTTAGGPVLTNSDYYGASIAALGDLDGDDVVDIAVGAYADDAGGTNRGAVHISFLNTDGSVKSTVELNDLTANGLTLANSDYYGNSVASLGDLNGDGITDIVVGAYADDAGGTNRGAVHISFLNADGSAKDTVKIDSLTQNGPVLADSDYYGYSVTSLGDLDGNGITEIVVGSHGDDTGGTNRGAVRIHNLKMIQNISGTIFRDTDGDAVNDIGEAGIKDVTVQLWSDNDNSDTITAGDTVVDGDITDSDGYYAIDAVADGEFIIHINDAFSKAAPGAMTTNASALAVTLSGGVDSTGHDIGFATPDPSDGKLTVTAKIDSNSLNGPTLLDSDYYGRSIASIGDLDGDGITDIVVGAYADDAGGTDRGAVHIHFLNIDGSIKNTVEINSATTNGPTLLNGDNYGMSVASLGDIDKDGVNDIAVGAYKDDAGGADRGAVYIHFLNIDGSVKSTIEINDTTANGPVLLDGDNYGKSLFSLGDLDNDGVNDIIVGADNDDAGGTDRGAVHISFLNMDGTVKSTVEINGTTAGGPTLANGDFYGRSVTALGDLNNDNVVDIAVGAYGDDTGGTDRGAVHISFLNADGSLDGTVKIDDSTLNGPTLADSEYYGISVVSPGDLNGDGIVDLITGANSDNGSGTNRGTFHISFLNADGSVKSTTEINDATSNGATLADNDYFGTSLASLGDLDGDGTVDIAVGATHDDTGGLDRGAVYIHYLADLNLEWTGGGADNNWSTAANWSGGAVPATDSYVLFDATSLKDVIIDVAVDVAKFTVDAAYAGDIDNATNNQNVTVAGDLTMSGAGTLSMGSGIWTVGGNVDIASQTTFDANTSTVKLTNTAAATLNTGTKQLNNLEFDGVGLDVSLNSDITVNGNLTITAGTLQGGARTITVKGDFVNSGTFTKGTSTLVFDGDATHTFNNTQALNNVTITANDTVTLASNLDIDGTFSNDGTVKFTGVETIVITTQDTDSGIFEFIGNGDGTPDTRTLTEIGATDYYDLVINDPNATKDTLQLGAATVIANDFTLTDGTFDQNLNSLTVDGAATCNISGGVFNQSAIITCAGDFNMSGGTFNGLTDAIDIDGNFIHSNGLFTSTSGNLNIAGNWNRSNGTFTHNSGTVELDGNNQTISGSTTFNNLTKNEASDDSVDAILTITAGTTQTINGVLTLDGLDDDDRLNIVSSASGTPATFDFEGSSSFSGDYLDIRACK